MAAPGAFSIADIRDLATRPTRFPATRPGTGFGYPQRPWAYGAAKAFYVAGRDEAAIDRYLDAALEGGKGPTPWKRARIEPMRAWMGKLVALDRQAVGDYIDSLFRYPLATRQWRGHSLRLPLGLLFEDHGARSMRLVAIENYLRFGRKGITMIAAASLAAAESEVGPLERCEIWHLRDSRISSYRTGDLRAWWPRLDRLLAYGEQRRSSPPAA